MESVERRQFSSLSERKGKASTPPPPPAPAPSRANGWPPEVPRILLIVLLSVMGSVLTVSLIISSLFQVLRASALESESWVHHLTEELQTETLQSLRVADQPDESWATRGRELQTISPTDILDQEHSIQATPSCALCTHVFPYVFRAILVFQLVILAGIGLGCLCFNSPAIYRKARRKIEGWQSRSPDIPLRSKTSAETKDND